MEMVCYGPNMDLMSTVYKVGGELYGQLSNRHLLTKLVNKSRCSDVVSKYRIASLSHSVDSVMSENCARHLRL
jgi:hypothetical protein